MPRVPDDDDFYLFLQKQKITLCPVQMESAAPATPIAPTAADTASRSAAKTPAARPLISHLCLVKECISLKDLKETWHSPQNWVPWGGRW